MDRERQRSLAGAASVGGLSRPGSWTQSVPPLHIGSSEEVVCPTVGVVAGNKGCPRDTPGRGGERVWEEAAEREQEEAVERLLQWRLGWLLERQLGRRWLDVWQFVYGHT